MILKFFGKEPANISIQTSIDLAREYMGACSGVVDCDRLLTGIRNVGLQATDNLLNETSWQQLDRDLTAGKPAIAWGGYGVAWRSQFPYYHSTGNGRTEHFNTILGRSLNGNYIICDPMYCGGAVEMNRDRLSIFFSNIGDPNSCRPYFISIFQKDN